MTNHNKYIWEIKYLQSPIEIKKFRFASTINELNEEIDKMREMNIAILEVKCLKTISY